jgi:hypothetical protein
MDPMSDDSMCNQLLVAHVCHTMLCFGLQLRNAWHCASEVKPKLMEFLATTPHQLLLNHSMSSMWIQ